MPSGLEEVRDYAFTQEPKASVPVFEVVGGQNSPLLQSSLNIVRIECCLNRAVWQIFW